MSYTAHLRFRLPDGRIVEYDDEDRDWKHPGDVEYWWTDGNGSCDCNRSIYMKRAGVKMEELGCGDTIELLSLEIKEVAP